MTPEIPISPNKGLGKDHSSSDSEFILPKLNFLSSEPVMRARQELGEDNPSVIELLQCLNNLRLDRETLTLGYYCLQYDPILLELIDIQKLLSHQFDCPEITAEAISVIFRDNQYQLIDSIITQFLQSIGECELPGAREFIIPKVREFIIRQFNLVIRESEESLKAEITERKVLCGQLSGQIHSAEYDIMRNKSKSESLEKIVRMSLNFDRMNLDLIEFQMRLYLLLRLQEIKQDMSSNVSEVYI